MSAQLTPYDRQKAVEYAHSWAHGRNPAYFNYEHLGGDCTNFASQCLYAGAPVMNWMGDDDWYYQDANRKAPAWTGVEPLYRFLTRPAETPGPAVLVPPEQAQPGDLVQLRFRGASVFSHTLVVVSAGRPSAPGDLLLADCQGEYAPPDSRLKSTKFLLHSEIPSSFWGAAFFLTLARGFACAAVRRSSLATWV